MDINILKTEITTDPLGRGYSGMTDEQVAVSLNTVDRERNLASITGDIAFSATDGAEFAALSATKQQLWLAFCGRETINPFGTSNVAFVQWIFGAGSTTVSNLANVRKEPVSRGNELGIGLVRPGDVNQARI